MKRADSFARFTGRSLKSGSEGRGGLMFAGVLGAGEFSVVAPDMETLKAVWSLLPNAEKFELDQLAVERVVMYRLQDLEP